MPDGRFAPSPTGDLHLGNLRTALVAWLFARSDGGRFLLRFEDLDTVTVRPGSAERQARDLAALGLDWDGEPLHQSDRLDRYRDVLARLVADDLAYPCYCSRREIREATQAPNGAPTHGHYPGTCRHLTSRERARREAEGRPPALRLRTGEPDVEFVDRLLGPQRGRVDDLVLQRNDGVPAYNLVVVIDDVDTGVELVVRADDLVSSTPRQLEVARVVGVAAPAYAHVPLVLNAAGDRLAKRDGAVTLADLADLGWSPAQVLGALAETIGLAEPGEPVTPGTLLERFDPERLPRQPMVFDAGEWATPPATDGASPRASGPA